MTTDRIAIAIAQANPTVGDLAGNLALARKAREQARAQGADLVVLSELFLAGYPPEDLVQKPSFQGANAAALEELARDTADGGPAVLTGVLWADEGGARNAAAFLADGAVTALQYKYRLPNYGVFDEHRVFAPGPLPGPVNFRGVRLGILICEDLWVPDVAECLHETGAEILVCINGSPWEVGKTDTRFATATARIVETGLPLLYVNQMCGQDELVFDGASFVLNGDRSLAVQLPAWEEAFAVTHWRRDGEAWRCERGVSVTPPEGHEAIYEAMVLGLRDYAGKNRFPGVMLGLSGGIDSALVAAVAVDALGADKVRCVMMPSRYTSNDSLEDAEACAKLLGVRYDTVPIAPGVAALDGMLGPLFDNLPPNEAEENMQSRLRGLLLMALSNKFGPLVLTTGNKSEVSVGYATLYGDMCGGYNPIKDVYKTTVFELTRWRNQAVPKHGLGPAGRVIPERIITKPPTAELRADQKDEDSLPPYPVLDDILECLVEQEMSVAQIIARGHDSETVRKVERLLYLAEYKRRQAPPGVKISYKNFGRDRRYPITNRYRDSG